MQAGAGDGGQHRAVNQRQRRELDEHGDVVRVADEAVGAGGDHAERHRRHHAHVPVWAEGGDHPDPERVGEHDQRERRHADGGDERAPEGQHLDRRAGQDAGVERDHRGEQRLADGGGAARGQRALVPARQPELDQAAGADRGDEHQEPADGGH